MVWQRRVLHLRGVLTLFATFETLGQKEERPAWFPLQKGFSKVDAHVHGPKEQGSRAAGYAVGPLFDWYFPLQAACGLLAVLTAVGWARSHPRPVHRWRLAILLLAMATVLLGWALECEVSELRGPRNEATDLYLRAGEERAVERLAIMKEARGNFARWHLYSLFLNFGTVILVTAGMAMASRLPEGEKSPATSCRGDRL